MASFNLQIRPGGASPTSLPPFLNPRKAIFKKATPPFLLCRKTSGLS